MLLISLLSVLGGGAGMLAAPSPSLSILPLPLSIFNLSGLLPGWVDSTTNGDSSVVNCTGELTGQCLLLSIKPFGSYTLSLTDPRAYFKGDALLDFYFRGAAQNASSVGFDLLRTEIQLYNSRYRLQSDPLTIASLTMRQGRVLSGPSQDGWIRAEWNLYNVTAFTSDLSLPSDWNALTLRDTSGQGFSLTLANLNLLPLPAPPSPSSSSSTGEIASVESAAGGDGEGELGDSGSVDSVPVFGIENVQDAADGDANRFILRLKPGVTYEQLQALCSEIDQESPSYRAVCRPPAEGADVASVQSLDAPVDWGFQAVRVDGDQDLQAMRSALSPLVAYIERDLQASTFRPTQLSSPSPATKSTATPTPATSQGEDLGSADSLPLPNATLDDRVDLPSGVASEVNLQEQDIGVVDPSGLGNLTASVLYAPSPAASWSLDRIDQINLPLDGKYGSGPVNGAGSHVFVLDTGVRASHVEFTGRVSDGQNCLNDGTTDTWDRNGHGSHVSGIVLGSTYGVARLATLHPVKVMGDNGQGGYANIISGLQWVKAYVQRNGLQGRSVVNLSVGGPRSQSLNDACTDLVNAGITVVVAAGNSHANACTFSPASSTGVITVGSTTPQDTMSSFSNYGNCLSIFAPGSNVVSVGYTCDTCSATMSGTSMASPAVAGAAALYLERYPTASPAQVATALENAAVERTFEPTSPSLLLNIMPSRLGTNPAPSPPPPTPSPPPPTPSPPPPAPAPSPKTPLTPPPAPPPPAVTIPTNAWWSWWPWVYFPSTFVLSNSTSNQTAVAAFLPPADVPDKPLNLFSGVY